VTSIYEAFSIGIATTFVIGAIATVLGLIAAVFLEEIPLRQRAGPPVATRPAPVMEKVPAGK